MVPRVSPPEFAVTPTETGGLTEGDGGGEGVQPVVKRLDKARSAGVSREAACLEKELMPLLYLIAARFRRLHPGVTADPLLQKGVGWDWSEQKRDDAFRTSRHDFITLAFLKERVGGHAGVRSPKPG